jgi:hypothetical protein
LKASGNAPCDSDPLTFLTQGGTFQLTEDFEDGANAFSGTAPWALGTPVRDETTHPLAPNGAASGTQAWGTNLTANYDDSTAGTATLSSRVLTPPGPGRNMQFQVNLVFSPGAGATATVFWVSKDNQVTTQLDTISATGANFVRRTFNVNSNQTGEGAGHLELRLTRDGQNTTSAGLFIDDFTYQAAY